MVVSRGACSLLGRQFGVSMWNTIPEDPRVLQSEYSCLQSFLLKEKEKGRRKGKREDEEVRERKKEVRIVTEKKEEEDKEEEDTKEKRK